MDLESCSVSSSSTASLQSSPPESAEDRMVDMELEAAEALADLAHLAMIENGGGSGAAETATIWGCKVKRVRKRVKTESPPGQAGSAMNPVDPEPPCSDPIDQDQVISDQQRDQTACGNILIKPAKADQDAESLKRSSLCATRYISMAGGRSRQNLTEAEKEERRVRRILANRESARQTIRRRQALCEELTRKAADLSQENESLKREKELAVKEYQSLETINKHLKAQVAKVMKSEVGETQGEVKLAHAEMSSSPTNCPLLLYNHHALTPLGWPSIIQSSQPVPSRHEMQNAVTFPSNISTSITGKLASSQEQENPTDSNVARTPLYVVPCPWFFPLHDSGSGFHAPISNGLKVLQDETSARNGYGSGSSSKMTADKENHHFLLPVKIKNEAYGLPEAQSYNDLNDIPVTESPQDGGCQQIGHYTREATLTPPPLSSVGGSFIVKHDNVLQSDYTGHTKAVSKIANHLVSHPEKKQEPVNYPSRKLVDAATAAEARKRRKELTKLKNLHGRQCGMQC
ncbi:uncharacterized protein LOC18040087 isoform X1 [Citrus clementina]|uniref:uncharacterized protein LOC18040087 isoform X1 n=1 Tax=Citrus clementina TaxID=85681 RepID=UPI000CED1169|nr:uncharacterized protein LOC18040087 isoform X1 [Citrus x clementina]